MPESSPIADALPPATVDAGPAANPAEFAAARDGAVLCRLDPLAVLAIGGPDATSFLHGQLSSDVKGLAADACQFTSYNSPKGRMLANFVLWGEGGEDGIAYRALLPGDIAETVRRRPTRSARPSAQRPRSSDWHAPGKPRSSACRVRSTS